MNDCKLTPFSSSEPTGRRRAGYESESFRAWNRRKRHFESRAGSMLAKICICLGILLGVVLAQAFLLDKGGVQPAVETGGSEPTGAEESDVLGKLRFVSAGGVKSVFKVSQRWDLPVNSAKNTALEQDDTLLCIECVPGSQVSASAGGEVRSIGTDTLLGPYVRISHGSDLESIYYGLTNIQVEKGQPLSPRDTLGETGEDGKLYVAVLQAGEAKNPAAYLDVDSLT